MMEIAVGDGVLEKISGQPQMFSIGIFFGGVLGPGRLGFVVAGSLLASTQFSKDQQE
jgi:hypothetical protein